ncbi:2-phospho-L-lactate guanylyltransferase [Marinomonas sp.]
MKNLCIVIPMKSPIRAKQRLRECLSNETREQLAVHLYEKTLSFFQQHFDCPCLVVSDSQQVLEMAQSYGTHILFDNGKKGLNGALQQACQWVKAQGFHQQLIVPGDIAQLEEDEISQLLQASEQAQVVIGVAKDGGTNALLTSPPDVIEFAYGRQSALAHQAQTIALGVTCECLHLANLALDIDQGMDLQQAIQTPLFDPFLAHANRVANNVTQQDTQVAYV